MSLKTKIAGIIFSGKTEKSARMENGFSLIEVLVAVFLMGIAIMGLAQIFTLAVLNNNRADQMANATFLAQQRIDFLRDMVSEELSSLTLLDGTPIPLDEQLDLNNDGTLDYRRITQLQHTGFYWDVRILVFPGHLSGESSATLLQNPKQYKVMADISTVISR
ncbi:MAG: prepilin-type N-terminal cleavage/methylation domain-containing protein [Candidatus Aminicenantes bacterium]|nr:prepilin-type N-terminal cleavage/methylation domain-containing protein [Candidatus Aminicenantes bacterium]